MIYLVLQIVFASAFTLIIKWIHLRKTEDVITVGALNYIVAAVIAFPFYLRLESNSSLAGAMLTGGSMGTVYFIAFFFVIHCVQQVGASITTVVSVLSLLFPITLAAILWKELPSPVQSSGIILAVISLLLISIRNPSQSIRLPKGRHWSTSIILLTFFVLCGCSRLAQETFKHVSEPSHRPVFLLSAFGVAAFFSVLTLLYRRKHLRPTEILLGTLMGSANLLQTQLILKCLETFPGYIVFTATSAGAIVLTTLVATGLMGERIERRTIAGIVLAVVSLFILA